jgi:threonine/homoserine/homoserine lactone efflux protein
MESVLKGLLSGLAYGFLLGPLFFVSLKVTLSRGIRFGLVLVLGAFLSDATLILGAWWGAARLSEIANDPFFQRVLGLCSALLILGFGISAIFPRKRDFAKLDPANPAAPARWIGFMFVQGFLFNMINPSNWLFWLSLATAAHADTSADPNRSTTALFLGATLVAVFITDISKVLIINKIGTRLTPAVIGKIIQIAGFTLMLVGCWILIKLVKNSF